MNFENMNSASMLLMLGFAAILIMFLFVMRSLDNLVRSLREERRLLTGNLDNLAQDIRSLRMHLNQPAPGAPATTAARPAPAQIPQAAAVKRASQDQVSSATLGLASPLPSQTGQTGQTGQIGQTIQMGQTMSAGAKNNALSSPTGAGKPLKDDFFLDLSPQAKPSERRSHTSGANTPSLELKL